MWPAAGKNNRLLATFGDSTIAALATQMADPALSSAGIDTNRALARTAQMEKGPNWINLQLTREPVFPILQLGLPNGAREEVPTGSPQLVRPCKISCHRRRSKRYCTFGCASHRCPSSHNPLPDGLRSTEAHCVLIISRPANGRPENTPLPRDREGLMIDYCTHLPLCMTEPRQARPSYGAAGEIRQIVH